jgi:hypothetical protein
MSYTLDAFCRDCRAVLKADPGPGGRQGARGLLERLLADQEFLAKEAQCVLRRRRKRRPLPGFTGRIASPH